MKHQIKSVLITLLCACMMLTASGCDNSESTGTNEPDIDQSDKLSSSGTISYSAKQIEIPGNPDSIDAIYTKGDTVYLYCTSYDVDLNGYYEDSENWFVKMNTDGSGASEFGRADSDGTYIQDMKVDSNGQIWLISSSASLDSADSVAVTLQKISSDGTLLDSCNLDFVSEYFSESIYPETMEFTDGYLYFLCTGNSDYRVLALESDGNMPAAADIAFDLDVGDKILDYMYSLIQTPDGGLYVYGSTKGCFAEILEKDWGETIELDSQYLDVYASEYGLYLDDGSNLYDCDIKTGELTKRLNWVKTGISFVTWATPLPNSSFLCVHYNYDGTPVFYIVSENESNSEGVQTLTIATYGDYYIPEAVIEFNNTHDDIKIEILDYSLYRDSDTIWSDILTKLNTDIISGSIPDIFDFGSFYELPISQYAVQGVLTDINSLIEADSSMGRSDYFENILDAYEIDGKLYEMPIEFTIGSLVTMKDTVDGKQALTLEEFTAILATSGASDPFGETSQLSAFNGFISAYSDVFIDWTTGECSFDSDEFINLLEAFKYVPEGTDVIFADENYEEYNTYQALRDGRQLFSGTGITGIDSIMEVRGLYGEDNYVFIGYPGLDEPATVVYSDNSYGISETCENKEAAWEFLKSLTYENSSHISMGLPIARTGFGLKVEDYKKEVEESGEQSHIYWLGEDVNIPYQIESDVEIIKNLIEEQTTVVRYDPDLNDIINEEVTAFFAGDKSAEETANLIQSRVTTYVNELL